VQSSPLGRAPATLACHDLESILTRHAAHDERFKYPVLANGVSKTIEGRSIEVLTRLSALWDQFIDWAREHVALAVART
jgi:hypothetical protein